MNLTMKEIRRLHERYLDIRKKFDDAKGILSPIRACLFTNRNHLDEFLVDYAALDREAQHELWRQKSSQIGYMAARLNPETQMISTAWSLCGPCDLEDNGYDREFAMQLAIERSYRERSTYRVYFLEKTHYGKSILALGAWPVQFYGHDNTLADQADAFLKRCVAYYKGAQLE